MLAVLVHAGVSFGQPLDTERIAAANEPSVAVLLGVKTDTQAPVQSSGCFVDASGLLLTTSHQVRGVERLRVRLADNREADASVLASDPSTEMALVKCAVPAPATARIGDAERLRAGAPLVAISAPEGLSLSVVNGIVSNLNRTYGGYRVIQTNLPASPGSSGGGVFDRNGALVGLVVSKLVERDWVTFVNPINNAYALLKRHGIHVQSVFAPLNDEDALEIIPADNLSDRERRAIEAYNAGVGSTSPMEKVGAYATAVKLLPSFYEAWFNLGVAYAATGNPPSAVEAYRRAVALRPDAIEPQRNLGRVLLAQSDLDAAAACFQRAVELAPDDAASYNDVGEAQRRSGNLDAAAESFGKALALRPEYPAAQYNLALTWASLGQNEKAAEAFEAYLGHNPGAEDALAVRGWIGRLRAAQDRADPGSRSEQ